MSERAIFPGLPADQIFVECPFCFAAITPPRAQVHYDWHVALGEAVRTAGGPFPMGLFSVKGQPL